jgi:hypothetical protein
MLLRQMKFFFDKADEVEWIVLDACFRLTGELYVGVFQEKDAHHFSVNE